MTPYDTYDTRCESRLRQLIAALERPALGVRARPYAEVGVTV